MPLAEGSSARSLARRVAYRLPEPVLYRLLRVRYGELPVVRRLWQLRPRLRLSPTISALDTDQLRRDVAAQVAAALDTHNLRYVAVPGLHETTAAVAVDAACRDDVWRALTAELSGPGWLAEVHNHQALLGRARRVVRLARRLPRRADMITIFRAFRGPGSAILTGPELGCTIEFWRHVRTSAVSRKDGGKHLPGTRIAPRNNGVVAYLTPEAWESAVREPSHWVTPKPLRSIFELNAPVDLVYTWVDGSDPAWTARKARHCEGVSLAELNESAAHEARFQSRDELRYSLRSVAMYAPWVRNIYIVTDDQVPPWLNTDDPQIIVVDHREIFRDPSVLPVFNSHAIESQLHHIPGLAEHYLYLNDDFFFGRPVWPETFFHGNGIAKFFLSRTTLDIDPPSRRDLPVLSAAKQNRALLEREFGVTIQNKFQHTPQPQLRSVLEEMERRHPEVFTKVAASRLRHPDDVSIPSALVHYYAYCLGKAVPASIAYRYQDISGADTARKLDALLRNRDAEVFCLNDTDSDPAMFDHQMAMLGAFLKHYYPIPCRFER